jgi:signal peptidase I
MNAQGWAGGASNPLPIGWPAGEFTSPRHEREPSQTVAKWRRLVFGRNPSRTLQRLVLWATGTLMTFHYLLVPIKVTGASMTPTYRDGSLNFINRLSYAKRAPRRNDVVILNDGEDLILKRVIAVPGERVTLEQGVFYINGEPLQDQFSKSRVNWEFDPVTLGPDEYFVIGDNRTYSIFGKFERRQIVGKIFF